MQRILFLLLLTGCLHGVVTGQERMDHRSMNYIYDLKPNSILYNDTLYTGSRQFQQLFFRQGDIELNRLYDRHQSNKIIGTIVRIAGSIVTLVGITMVSDGQNKGTGWALIGSGFGASLVGSYLTLMGRKNLWMAVTLFNQKNGKAALGMGVSQNSAGLVYKF